jgi:hypothetical protein
MILSVFLMASLGMISVPRLEKVWYGHFQHVFFSQKNAGIYLHDLYALYVHSSISDSANFQVVNSQFM